METFGALTATKFEPSSVSSVIFNIPACVLFPEICTTPEPLGAKVISPLAASVIVTVLEVVPLLVLRIKSVAPPVVTVKVPAPLERRVAAAAASPTVTVSATRIHLLFHLE